MASTLFEMKTQVLGFMLRNAEDFNVDGVDVLTKAVQRAVRAAERKINFQLSRVQVNVEVPAAGVSLDTALLTSDVSEAVLVKNIEQPYTVGDTGTLSPIAYNTWEGYHQRVKRRADGNISLSELDTLSGSAATGIPLTLLRHGNNVHLRPASFTGLGDPQSLVLDVVRWQKELSLDADTNFILDYCEDWVLWRSIIELNLFVKEAQRIAISNSVHKDQWSDIVTWNESLVSQNVDDLDLD